jgi:hypothetical protein
VSFLPPEGSVGRPVDLTIPLTGAGTAVLDQSVGIPLDVAGTWSVQVSGSTSTGALTGAIRTFTVTDPSAPGGGTVAPTGTTAPATGTTEPGGGGPIVTVIVDPNLTTTTTTTTTAGG